MEATIVRLGKNGKKVKKISIMGYSLGGLITRYAIGVLGQRGLFNTIEPEVKDKKANISLDIINVL